MNLLFLSRWYPWPADHGARLRVLNLLRSLATRHVVDLISFAEEPVLPAALEAMRGFCASVRVVPYRPFRPQGLRALAGFLDPRPRSVVDTHNSEFADAVVRFGRIDGVIASQIDMLPYALVADARWRLLEELEAGVIFGAVATATNPLRRLRARLTRWKLARYVRQSLRRFDACTVVSERERALAMALGIAGDRIDVIPNGADTVGAKSVEGAPIPNTCIYAGALTYSANHDAVRYFLTEIWPTLRTRHPELTFTVTGRTTGVDLAQLSTDARVHFPGYLEDVRPAVASSWLSIVPLRVGGGTRLKVLESMALGTPVVSTSKGCEGLDLRIGEEVLVADTAQEFAAAVGRVLLDADLRARLSMAGCQAAKRYDWSLIGNSLLAVLERFEQAGGG
jgi:glycosyltransferase involved in cell wall biosynthesis